MGTYHSDDNENVVQGNETGPIFVKVHPFFGRPVGEMCEDKRFNEKETVKLHLPYRVKDKESDLFNFHIFANHYRNIRAMTTKNMPCSFPSLEDFLSKTLPEPHCHVSAERMLHWVNSGSGQKCVTFKAFLCGCFNPITVGNVAASYCKFTFTGDIFPQFIMASDVKMEVVCVLCPVYQDWKKETVGNASKRNANTLEGCRQIYEHSVSKCHKSAIDWWKSSKLKTMKEIPIPKPEIKITNFVKSSPSARSNCLYLWDVEIVSNFENDKYIRRYQPKTLFKKRQLWTLCEDTIDHANCQNYLKWKYLHNQEFEELCQESNASCKSLYVPGETNVIINGKSVLIGAGIKSIDPPCLGKASPFGPHPYTCDACWNQRVDLKDVLNKRKKSRLIPGRSRLGVCGFRKSYASKSETEVKSEELNAENVSLKKENRSLRRLYLDKKSWGKCWLMLVIQQMRKS